MHYVLPPHLQEGLIVTQKIPPYASTIMLPYAEAVLMEGSFGSLLVQEEAGDQFNLRLHILQINHPIQVSILTHQPSSMLIYMLQGPSPITLNEQEAASIMEGSYYLIYVPSGLHPVPLEAGSYTIVQIELSPDLLAKFSSKYFTIFEVWDSIYEKSPFCLLQDASRITGRIREALNRMLYCSHEEEEERSVYQQARVLDLLLLFAEDITNKFKDAPGRFNFSPADIRAVLEAGDLKIERAGDSLPLKDIARKKNLHPKKLQAGFKLVYGLNTRELTNEARMEKAKALLIESDKSIAEIAYETGYCNDSSFIRAFKRHVGVTPAFYRK